MRGDAKTVVGVVESYPQEYDTVNDEVVADLTLQSILRSFLGKRVIITVVEL